MSWLYLVLAIVLEVTGTTSMNLSEGFSRLAPSLAVPVCYVASVSLLTLALRRIDVSVAYALWSGVGTALITAIGLIVVGVVGLNLSGAAR